MARRTAGQHSQAADLIARRQLGRRPPAIAPPRPVRTPSHPVARAVPRQPPHRRTPRPVRRGTRRCATSPRAARATPAQTESPSRASRANAPPASRASRSALRLAGRGGFKLPFRRGGAHPPLSIPSQPGECAVAARDRLQRGAHPRAVRLHRLAPIARRGAAAHLLVRARLRRRRNHEQPVLAAQIERIDHSLDETARAVLVRKRPERFADPARTAARPRRTARRNRTLDEVALAPLRKLRAGIDVRPPRADALGRESRRGGSKPTRQREVGQVRFHHARARHGVQHPLWRRREQPPARPRAQVARRREQHGALCAVEHRRGGVARGRSRPLARIAGARILRARRIIEQRDLSGPQRLHAVWGRARARRDWKKSQRPARPSAPIESPAMRASNATLLRATPCTSHTKPRRDHFTS